MPYNVLTAREKKVLENKTVIEKLAGNLVNGSLI